MFVTCIKMLLLKTDFWMWNADKRMSVRSYTTIFREYNFSGGSGLRRSSLIRHRNIFVPDSFRPFIYLESCSRRDLRSFSLSPVPPAALCGIPHRRSDSPHFGPEHDCLTKRSRIIHVILNDTSSCITTRVEFRTDGITKIMNTSIVHYSQTRRKACKDCVKGKRRCDLILPRCGRCVKRDVECVYVSYMI